MKLVTGDYYGIIEAFHKAVENKMKKILESGLPAGRKAEAASAAFGAFSKGLENFIDQDRVLAVFGGKDYRQIVADFKAAISFDESLGGGELPRLMLETLEELRPIQSNQAALAA